MEICHLQCQNRGNTLSPQRTHTKAPRLLTGFRWLHLICQQAVNSRLAVLKVVRVPEVFMRKAVNRGPNMLNIFESMIENHLK